MAAFTVMPATVTNILALAPGFDFERKIIVKRNAPELLEKYFNKKGYEPVPIMLSGNTDCYQPIERKLKITRGF
jgi:DNA repair photolyase